MFKMIDAAFALCFSQNDDEGSDFDLPPSWVAPVEISLKGDKVVQLYSNITYNLTAFGIT